MEAWGGRAQVRYTVQRRTVRLYKDPCTVYFWVLGWSVPGTPGAVGLSRAPLPGPKLRPKNQSACSFFCYEAGRRDPPPPSFNQPPIVKYEHRRPPSPLKISLLFSHTNCLPYKPPTAHNTQASGGLHIPNPVSTSHLCKSQHALKYSPLDLIGVALFPLAPIFRSSAAIQALAAVAAQNLVPAWCLVRFLSTQRLPLQTHSPPSSASSPAHFISKQLPATVADPCPVPNRTPQHASRSFSSIQSTYLGHLDWF